MTLHRHFLPVAVLLVVGAIFLGYFASVALEETGGQLGAPLDDTWIHLVFARNIAAGQGFSFNPGEPTPGSTAPLWTLLLAPMMWISTEPEFVLRGAIGLSVLFYLCSALLTYGWIYELSQSRMVSLFSGLLVLSVGRFVWAGLSGMEVTFFTALTLLILWQYQRRGLTVSVALWLGLASQVRPEAHFLVLVIGVDLILRQIDRNHLFELAAWVALVRKYAIPALIYIAVNVPHLVFSLLTTGKPLANTFYAKSATSAGGYHLDFLLDSLQYVWWDNAVVALLLPIGLWQLWGKSRVAALWFIGLPLAYGFVLDGLWHHGRYLMPLTVVQMGAGALALDRIFQKILPHLTGVPVKRFAPALFGLLLIPPLFTAPLWAQELGNNAREIIDIDIALAEWLAEETGPDELIAVDDIGAIGYISQRRIIDMNGLVSPEVWPAVRQAERVEINREMVRLLSQVQPDWVASFQLWRWEIVTNPLVAQEIHSVQTPTHTIILQPDAYIHQIRWPYLNEIDPEYDSAATFDGLADLAGYDWTLDDEGRSAVLTFYWMSQTDVEIDYKFFLHVLNQEGEIVSQIDRFPVDGLAVSSVWQPGDLIWDQATVPLPTEPGSYEIKIGWYDETTGQRIPVAGTTDNAYMLRTWTP